MKKIYLFLSALLLVFLLTIGVSALFGATDDAAPKLTFSGLMDGNYSGARRDYYAKKFPKSGGLVSMNTTLNGFYHFSGLSDSEDVQLILDMNTNAANGGASLENPQTPSGSAPDTPSVSGSEPDGSTSESSSAEAEPTEETPPHSSVADDAVVENLGSAILIDNRAVEVPYANYDAIEDYADAVTAIATALGSDVRTFNIAVPNGAEFYTPEDYHTGSNAQIDMIDFCYDHLGDNVIPVDAYSKLSAHIDEYLYFRTDHHWTQLGAYYAYTAYCEAAGLTAEPLSKFETGQYDNFTGSMYNFLSNYPQAQILREDPDTLYYYSPFVDTKARFYEDATLSAEYIIGVISYIGSDVSNKYLCFLGGDHPITIVNTDVNNGKVCMLIKESYGNAFAPWLTSHYSKIVVVDPREFNTSDQPSLDLAAFAKEQGVDDCIILDYPMMLNSDGYIGGLQRLVK